MGQPNNYELLKTLGAGPVENEIDPPKPEPERNPAAPSPPEYLTVEDRVNAEALAFHEVQKQKFADGKINGPEFHEQFVKFDAEQRRRLEAGYYDSPSISDARSSEDNSQKRDERDGNRGNDDAAPSEAVSSKEEPSEREGAEQAEMTDQKAEKMAKMRAQFEKTDFELAARQATRPHDRGGRE